MKLISMCIYLFLQRKPKNTTEKQPKQIHLLVKRHRIVGKGAKQWITADRRV